MVKNQNKDFEEKFALHRYYLWSNRMKEEFIKSVDFALKAHPKHVENMPTLSTHNFMYFSYWMASLFVVVEEWKEHGIKDENITKLLTSSYLPKMKRFRNGVFHFQKNYYDQRFSEFLREGEDMAKWAQELHVAVGDAFLRWFGELGLKYEINEDGNAVLITGPNSLSLKFVG